MINISDLKIHSLHSIKWVYLGNLVPKIISPFITIWIARILNPADYGLVAICMVIIGFVDLVQGFGAGDYVIKNPDSDQIMLSTAFWSNLIFGFVAYSVLIIAVPLITKSYGNPAIQKILPILGLSIPFNSCGTIQLALLQQQMKFRHLSIIRLAPLGITIAITLPLAYSGFGVWALVVGGISNSFACNMAYWINQKWLPSLSFSFKQFKNIYKFGGWVTIERIEEYTYSSLDRVILGYVGMDVLGVYSVARQIIGLVFNIMYAPIQNITYPLFSKLQDDLEMLLKGLLKILKRTLLLSLPVTIGISLLSHIAIPILFGQKWAGLALALSILIIGEGFQLNMGAQRELFKIINRPDIYPKSLILNVCFAFIFYYIASFYGLIAFCIIRIMNDCLFVTFQIFLTSTYLKINLRTLLKPWISPLMSSFIMGAIITSLIIFLKSIDIKIDIIYLLFIIVIGIATYFLTYMIFNKTEWENIISELKVVFRPNRIRKSVI